MIVPTGKNTSLNDILFPGSIQANNGKPFSGNSGKSEEEHLTSQTMILSHHEFSFDDPFDDEPVSTTWQRHQSVTHSTFGRGVIEKVEQKSEYDLTVRFRGGIKKLDAAFVKTI